MEPLQITIKRLWPKDKYTIGRLYINGEHYCNTLEPPLKEKAPNMAHPAIPPGTYRVKMHNSPKFKGLRPILLDVPGRSYILIHEGNHVSNTLGCILVGWNQKVGYLNNSWKALKPLMQRINTALLQGREVKLTVNS